MDNLNMTLNAVMTAAGEAGFITYREFSDAAVTGKKDSMIGFVGIGSRKEIAQGMVGSALMSEVESVITVKLFGRMCSYRDIYVLEDHISLLFEKLAMSGDLLSRVTKLSQIKQDGALGRLGAEIELTVRTLETGADNT